MKITNSNLFRAMKWLTENTTDLPDGWLDTMNSREIMNLFLLRTGSYTVEYGRGGRTARWSKCNHDVAVRRVAAVVSMAEELGGVSYLIVINNEGDDVSRQFNIPAWL